MKFSYLLLGAAGIAFATAASAQYFEQLRQMCANYGFQPGTDAFAQCVQKLDAEVRANQGQQAAQHCQQIAQQIRQWCGQSYPNMPLTAAGFCGQAQGQWQRSGCGR